MSANVAARCAWCGRPLGADAAREPRRIRCASCGAETTYPPPDDDELERAYRRYRPASGRFAGPGDRLLGRSRALLAGRVDRIAPAGPVLDVGAGDGTLVRALGERGREAVGLEREGAADSERVIGADVRELSDRWAAIVFWHSLEHLRDAGEVLAHAASLLSPGGVLVVAIPNLASLQARAFEDRWLALDLPRHLVHVPAPALIDRVQAAGLTVERVSHWRGGQLVFGWLDGMVGSLPGGLRLYDAIRRPAARQTEAPARRRGAALAAGTVLLPAAAAAALAEVAMRRGGSVYLEARRG